jgi:hypothetical protein
MGRSDALVDFEVNSERLLAPADVARVLGVPVATLANWRSGRTGPIFLKVVRHAEDVTPGQ